MASSDTEIMKIKKKQTKSGNITSIVSSEDSGIEKKDVGKLLDEDKRVKPKNGSPKKGKRKRHCSESEDKDISSSSDFTSSDESSSEYSESNSSGDSSSSEGSMSESSSTSSNSESDERKKVKKGRKRHHSPLKKRRRTEETHFNPRSKDEKTAWKLTKSQAKYVVKNFNSYVPERTLKESILEERPVPKNIGEAKGMDTFIRDLLTESHKNFAMDNDKRLRKVQNKIFEVMGPLGSLWKNIAKAKRKGQVKVPGKEIAKTLDQSVLLLGQVNNSLNYLRRLSALTSLGIEKGKASSMLKDNSELFKPKRRTLYGSKFCKLLKRKNKEIKSSRSLIKELQKKKNRPFSDGPSGRGAYHRHGGQHTNGDQHNRDYRSRGNRRRGGYRGDNYRGRGRGKPST